MLLIVNCIVFGGLALWVCRAAAPGIVGTIMAILAALAVAATTWTVMPTLAPNFYDLPALLLGVGALGIAFAVLRSFGTGDLEGASLRPGGGVLAVAAFWMLFLWISSWGMMRGDTYRNLVAVTEKPLDNSIELIDQSHARLVDRDLAKRRALELLGSEKGLGSSFVIGDPVVQIVAGKQVWVAPLEPAGFWVWLRTEGSPGYVVVSATNYSEAEIRLNHPMRFTRDSWFWRNLDRHAWTKDPNVGQTDYGFEIDDAGKPYWIVALYDHMAGGSGPKVTGVMTVDAGSGEIATYALGKEPSWIDRVQPEWIAEAQMLSWGDYVHGFWNFGSLDVVHPTEGMSLVHLKDGRSAWFTGMVNMRSQKGNASAADGFALYDSKLGTATVYYQQGVSESAAQAALQGAVQREGYLASHPIAYTVHGALTYVATLKDAAGNPQMVGMASALDRSVTATGRSLDDVTRAYASRLRTASSRVTSLGSGVVPQDVTGTLVRSGGYSLEGRSHQLVRLSVDGADRDFDVDLSIGQLRAIVLALPGDRVDLKVLASEDGVDEIRDVKVTPRG